jgi:signal transduction histidine kinase
MRRLKWRLAALGAIVTSVTILLAWVGYKTIITPSMTEIARAQEMNALVARMSADEWRYIEIANHVESAVSEMDTALHGFTTREDPGEWERFQRKAQDFRDWMQQEKSSWPSGKTVDFVPPVTYAEDLPKLLDEIEKAYLDYVEAAQQFVATSKGSNSAGGKLTRSEEVDALSHKLLVLAGRARARGEAIQLINVKMPQFPLRQMLMLALILTFGTTFIWLAVIAYRKEVNRKLNESQSIIQRQEKFAHLGELAAVVAHEIKNPLTAINARLYTLQRTLTAGSGEHTDATVIRTEIQRLDQIVKNFLKLDRPNEAQPTLLTAEPMLNEVRDLFAPHLEKQSIILTVESATHRRFRGDAQQLKQVLINLVQNAADSIRQNGTITLRAREANARLKGHDSEAVVLEVEDTGPGIPPEIQERLFHPFFTTKQDGTGLGLPISARIIDKLGGKLDFQTRLHHGTTFRVMLPVHDKTE